MTPVSIPSHPRKARKAKDLAACVTAWLASVRETVYRQPLVANGDRGRVIESSFPIRRRIFAQTSSLQFAGVRDLDAAAVTLISVIWK